MRIFELVAVPAAVAGVAFGATAAIGQGRAVYLTARAFEAGQTKPRATQNVSFQ